MTLPYRVAAQGRRVGLAALAGLVLLVASPVIAATASGPDAVPPAFYDDALRRHRDGDYDGAVIQLKNVLQRDPENLAARLLIGRTYLALDRVAAAEKELLQALRRGADPVLVAVPLADAFLKQGKYLELLEEITVRGLPRDVAADVLLARGRAHIGLEQPNRAAENFQAALAHRADFAAPLVGLAQIALAKGEIDAAQQHAARARVVDSDSDEVWFALGEISRVLQDPDAALQHYDRAVALAPGSFVARMARAATLMDLGRHDDALIDIELLRTQRPADHQVAYLLALALVRDSRAGEGREVMRALTSDLDRLDPGDLQAHPPNVLVNGVAHYALGDLATAKRHLKTFVRLRPRHTGARRLLGRLLIDNGEASGALGVLRPALSITPDDAALHALVGAAQMQLGRFDEAIASYERAAGLAPDSASLHTRLALARIAAGETEQALSALAAELGGDPQDRRGGVMLAFTQFSSGRYGDALATTQELVDHGAQDPVIHNLAGAARLALGQVAAARASFESVLARDPTFTPARYNLAIVEFATGNLAAAKAHYVALYNDNVNETRAMLGLAKIAEAEGKLGEAIGWLERLKQHNAAAVGPQVRLVDLYLRTNQPETALETARQLEELGLDSVPMLEVLARAEAANGNLAKAAISFQRVAELAGDSVGSLLRIHRLQLAAADVSGARQTLERAQTLDPGSLTVLVALARLTADTGDLEGAFDRARALRRSHPTSAAGDSLLGDVLGRLGRHGEAAEAYARGQQTAPSSGLIVRFHQASRNAGDATRGLAGLEAWLADHPADVVVRRALATAYIDVGRHDAAVAAHELLLEVLPDDAAILNNLAWLYQRVADPRALGLARRAHALAPNEPGLSDTLGWILVQQGQAGEGLAILRDAEARAAGVAEIDYHIGVALSQLGRTDEARAALERGLASGLRLPDEAQARALLRRLSAD